MATETQVIYRNSEFQPIKTSFKANDERIIVGWNYLDRRRDEQTPPEFVSHPDAISGFSVPVHLYACWGYGVQLTDSLHGKIRVSPDRSPGSSYKKYLNNESVQFSADIDNGYRLKSWKDGSTENPRTRTINSNLEESFQTEIVRYDIEYHLNEGTNSPENPTSYYISSDTIVLKDPTREDYRFDGWYPSNTIPSGSYGDRVFEARFVKKDLHVVDMSHNESQVTADYNGYLSIFHNGQNAAGSFTYQYGQGSTTEDWWTDTIYVRVYVNDVIRKSITSQSYTDETYKVSAGDVIRVACLFKYYHKATDSTGSSRWIENGSYVYNVPSGIGYVQYSYYD